MPAKRGGNVAAGTALQQHYDDDEKANKDVDDGDQCNHEFEFVTFVDELGISDANSLCRKAGPANLLILQIYGAEGGI